MEARKCSEMLFVPTALILTPGPEISHYPQRRLLNKEEEERVKELAKLKVSTKVLRKHASDKYGKNLRLYDT